MVFALEPMVNEGTFEVRVLSDGWTVVTADGKRSAHFEHTIALSNDGAEFLSTLWFGERLMQHVFNSENLSVAFITTWILKL
jgi:hypothetical protein